MRRTRSTVLAACVALALGASVAAQQTVQDRTTFVTFSGPVSIPGKTLPAGTYTFRLADSQADRHIVQIFDKDGANLMATLLAVPAERAEQDGEPVITFKETASDRAPAVRYWYYAGERAGNEFVYPKNQAMTIARASGEPVMSVDSTSSSIDDWKKGAMSRVNPSDAAAATTTSSTSARSTTSPSATAPATTAPSTANQPPASTTSPDTTTPRSTTPPEMARSSRASADRDRMAGTSGRTPARHLPKTASELPLVGLIGLVSLGGALALRAARL